MHKDTYTTANPYTDNGYSSRADYLAQLCDEYPADVVHTLADLLGDTEDFDGLVTMLEDYRETEDDDAGRSMRAIASALFPETDAARDAAAVLSVHAARDALADAYAKAGAALDAASDARNTASDALDAASDAHSAARHAHFAARDVYEAASAALDAAD